ncbi:CD320 antigen isoform X1 [Protopterus annectens]|uniref:CD320 antigen isoform X1 n=1 Tax=Protopterus annectens TaxID=7888 RepID=UPI001CFBE922|nr:CD320 antigen isoform X1 [Protopterus annectens]
MLSMCRSNMKRQMLSLGLFKITLAIFLFLNGSEGASGDPVKSCHAAQFLCNTGICIPLIWKCDGDEDCTDGSDEGDCHNITCSGFRCNDGLCIPLTWRCDRELDCKDGSDEAIDVCGNVSCKRDEFRCLSNICIDVKLLCDGRNDCGDRSDENCTPVPCGPLEFHCNVSGSCLSTSQLCDGVVHCPDGSDEMNEKCLPGNPSSTTCLSSEFQCGPAECIPNTWVCDGHPDCEDGQDERGCGETAFLLFADGRGIGRLDAMGKPIMVTAVKNVGALTADISSLQVFWTNTVHHAVFRNLLDQNLGTAQVLAHAQRPAGIAVDWLYRNVYWSDTSAHTLNMALMDGTNKRTLFRDDMSSPFAVAVDPFSGYIFWSDVGASAKIEKAAMNGVRRIALVTTDIHKPVALALDYAEGHLYWTDSKLRRISRIDLMVIRGRLLYCPRNF